jgi:hypothetical protein
MNRRSLVIGVFLAILVIGSFVWRSAIHQKRVLPPVPASESKSLPSPSGGSKVVDKKKDSVGPDDAQVGSATDPKKTLGAFLLKQMPGSVLRTAHYGTADALSDLVFGDDDGFRKMVREAKTLLGDNYAPAIQGLLENMKSPSYRSILLLMLGAGHCAESIPLLKSALAEGQDVITMNAAAYSLGVMQNDEAFAFLSKYHETLLSKAPDLRGLIKVVQAGLAANGEKAIPMLLEGLKGDAAADIAKDGVPENYEASLRGYHNSWLAHLRMDHVPESLQQALKGDLEPRVRHNILFALAANKCADTYKFLADTFRENPDALVKSSVVQAIFETLASPVENASKQSEEIRPLLGTILRDASSLDRVSYPMADSLVMIACKLDTEQSRQWLQSMIKRDLGAVYGDDASDLRNVIAWRLGFLQNGEPLLQDLLKSIPAGEDPAVLQSHYYRNSNVPFNNEEAVQSLLSSMKKFKPDSPDFFTRLTALERASVDREAVVAAFQSAYVDAEKPASRLRMIVAGGNLGDAASPFLDSIVRSQDGLVLRVLAADQLLRVSTDANLQERLWGDMNSILAPVNKIGGDVFYTMSSGRNMYGDLIRDYYSRFGTPRDIPLLQALPSLVSFDSRAPEDWVTYYRSSLRTQCLQAEDTIALRAVSR